MGNAPREVHDPPRFYERKRHIQRRDLWLVTTMNKRSIISNLVTAGHASELLAVLEGESRFSDAAAPGAPENRELARLWIAAQYHLRFVSEFAENSPPQTVGGKLLSSFPDEFDRWVEAGAPGVTDLEFERLASLLN